MIVPNMWFGWPNVPASNGRGCFCVMIGYTGCFIRKIFLMSSSGRTKRKSFAPCGCTISYCWGFALGDSSVGCLIMSRDSKSSYGIHIDEGRTTKLRFRHQGTSITYQAICGMPLDHNSQNIPIDQSDSFNNTWIPSSLLITKEKGNPTSTI